MQNQKAKWKGLENTGLSQFASGCQSKLSGTFGIGASFGLKPLVKTRIVSLCVENSRFLWVMHRRSIRDNGVSFCQATATPRSGSHEPKFQDSANAGPAWLLAKCRHGRISYVWLTHTIVPFNLVYIMYIILLFTIIIPYISLCSTNINQLRKWLILP